MAINFDSVVGERAARASADRRLYTAGAVVALLVVLIGFAPSYYLKAFFGGRELSLLVHMHGLVMTSWVVLFFVQARLVASGKVAVHRKLGAYGVIVAALVVIVGTTTAIVAARNGVSPPGAPPALVFLAIPIGDMLLFTILFTSAILLRRRSDFHKRLMLVTTLGILTAAIARIPLNFLQAGGLPAFFAVTDLILIGTIAYDTVKNRRLHPAFGWGFAVVILSQVARFLVAGTPQWLQFATWLTS